MPGFTVFGHSPYLQKKLFAKTASRVLMYVELGRLGIRSEKLFQVAEELLKFLQNGIILLNLQLLHVSYGRLSSRTMVETLLLSTLDK